MAQRLALAAVLVGFLSLGAVYSWVNPLFEAPDELWHFLYIEQVKATHSLPVAGPDVPGLNPHQEATQPPLYYLIATALTAPLDTRDLADALQFNPSYDPFHNSDPRTWSFLVHTEKENPQLSHFSRAAHLDRLLSLLLGAGTVLFTYLLGRAIFPSRPLVAIGAAAVMAFNPQFLFLSASINNDNAVTFFSAVSLYLLAGLLAGDGLVQHWIRYLFLGVCLGLAALSKLSGLGLLFLCMLSLGYHQLRIRTSRLPVAGVFSCGLGFAIVAGWWYVRNLLLYGDPLAVRPMVELTAQQTRTILAAFGQMGELFTSYWLSFGWSTVNADAPIYAVFGAICLLALLGAIRGVAKTRATWSALPAGSFMLLAWLAIMIALMLRWMTSAAAPQGRLLFPAMPAISVLLSWGVTSLVSRGRTALVVVSSLTLLAVSVSSLFLYIVPQYPIWPVYAAAAAPHPTRESGVVFGDAMQLVGVVAPKQEAQPGGHLPVDLLWRVTRTMDRRLSSYAQLASVGSRRKVGEAADRILGQERFPIAWWKPGDVTVDSRSIQVAANVEAPVLADLAIGMYDTDTRAPLEAIDVGGRQVPNASPVRVRIRPPQPPDLRNTTTSGQVFGDDVTLVVFSYPSEIHRGVDGIRGQLYWRADRALGKDLTVFVHLSDGATLVGQYDAQPRGGDYPTSAWQIGEVVPDSFFIPSRDLPPGTYTLQVGLYELSSGQRLHVGREDTLRLGTIDIHED